LELIGHVFFALEDHELLLLLRIADGDHRREAPEDVQDAEPEVAGDLPGRLVDVPVGERMPAAEETTESLPAAG